MTSAATLPPSYGSVPPATPSRVSFGGAEAGFLANRVDPRRGTKKLEFMVEQAIHVELNEFCGRFSGALEPFAGTLEETIRGVRRVSDDAGMGRVSSALLDNQHRLTILRDKARQQNTYLVIFGPLKSGKSTLMNAISGSYVSEVSSLPAYPCLVYVHEGEERGFSLTRFNGEREEFSSPEELQATINEAHAMLAREIRKADEAGDPFNPAEDFDEAVRRIDFSLPAPALRESGTILVDTPGLYTKMKYNYGQLTRDFRDTAACAVFVVKTDNLFFEQVFDEFADLLNVFSRVFLVVNIDSSKKDLSPSGDLEPALESRDPRKIVEAFETLTVNAQIRSAIDSGRLRIYLIDLLHTAESRLHGGAGMESTASAPVAGESEEAERAEEEPFAAEADGDAVGSAADAARIAEEDAPREEGPRDRAADVPEAAVPEDTAPEDTVAGREAGPELGFDAFLNDLTEYLNSSDYLVEFMCDSLRQAESVLAETGEHCDSEAVSTLRAEVESLREESEQKESQLRAVQYLTKHDWEKPLAETMDKLRETVGERVETALPGLKANLRGEVDNWFGSDDSLSALLNGQVRALVLSACGRARGEAADLIAAGAGARDAGLELNSEVLRNLRDLGISLEEIHVGFSPDVRGHLAEEPALPDPAAMQADLPVRRTFLDWILFRSPTSVRRRLLGQDSPSDTAIPAAVKSRKLGEAGRDYLRGAVEAFAENAFARAVTGEVDRLLGDYAKFFKEQLGSRLESEAGALGEVSADLKDRFAARRYALDAVDRLVAAMARLRDEVTELRARYVAGKENLDSAAESSKDTEDAETADDPEEENPSV